MVGLSGATSPIAPWAAVAATPFIRRPMAAKPGRPCSGQRDKSGGDQHLDQRPLEVSWAHRSSPVLPPAGFGSTQAQAAEQEGYLSPPTAVGRGGGRPVTPARGASAPLRRSMERSRSRRYTPTRARAAQRSSRGRSTAR